MRSTRFATAIAMAALAATLMTSPIRAADNAAAPGSLKLEHEEIVKELIYLTAPESSVAAPA